MSTNEIVKFCFFLGWKRGRGGRCVQPQKHLPLKAGTDSHNPAIRSTPYGYMHMDDVRYMHRAQAM